MSKYENGYWPKIKYWTTQLKDEVFNTKKPELEEVLFFQKTLSYFMMKQWELDNPIKQEEFSAVR